LSCQFHRVGDWKIEAKAEVVDGMANAICVMLGGQPRFATLVKALKEGVALGGQNHSGTQGNGLAKQGTP
jgi:hypothetical protein